eukprot:COSAG01_NODE_196_length_22350_cov_812.929136_12_plen_75_part_00
MGEGRSHSVIRPHAHPTPVQETIWKRGASVRQRGGGMCLQHGLFDVCSLTKSARLCSVDRRLFHGLLHRLLWQG